MVGISASQVKELRERTGLGMMECKKALVDAAGDIDKAIEDLRKSSGMKAAKKAGRTAADGVVAVRVAAGGEGYGVIVEVNSETDFVARDDSFRAFVQAVVDKAFVEQQADVAALMAGELETARQALVQKIGENISVRRIVIVRAPRVGSYVHSNSRIAVLAALTGGSEDLARDIAMHVAAVNPPVVRPADMPQELIAKEKALYLAQAQDSGKPAEIIDKMVAGRLNKFLAESSLVEQPFVKDPEIKIAKLLKAAGADVASFVRFEVGEGIEVAEVDFAAEVAAQVNAKK